MGSQLTMYITLVCTSGVLNLYLCLYAFSKRHKYTNIANYFIFYTAAISIYCFASAMTLISTTLEQISFWNTILYIGMPTSATLGLLYVMSYLGFKLSFRRSMLILLIPFITIIMVATNHWHHLHYRVFELDPNLGAPFVYQEIGMWYMVHGVYTFASMFVAFLLLLSHWKETAKAYRPQLIALMFGQLVPILTAFLYLNGLTPAGVDPVPMILWLSSLLYLWAINSSRLFRIMPIAKDTIYNSINDGAIVLDESYRLIEFNQASKAMMPNLNKSMFGNNFVKFWKEQTGEALPFKLVADGVATQEIKLCSEGMERIYQVRITSLDQARNRKGLLLVFTDITEVKRLQEKLEQQAYNDELTKIYNRRAFIQQSEQDFEAARETGLPFTVLLMDIDYFKRVNDTYGHHVGDQLLVHVVKVCQTQLQEGHFFARYGGEEFVIALKGYKEAEGITLADRLRGAVEKAPLMTEAGNLSATLSIGVAEVKDWTEETLYQLLHKADTALYAAKEEGRNLVKVYGTSKEILN
ncbi:diguanylate cyclase (GGDEF)-like protein/PAS domain S-box-containing protein [Solibacillus kalamii]|uniref:Diguanylate cyclase n=1 Tax=Solibacillus kalamii TaxID=1748298 RepID=A0ABX3ZFJ9_9BACL|nr:histidine kinase N-terminal 7TM domain-containing protein [Solibacillus kalamii]MBM7665993.1 diguanylate cyclase (GGDEF)-like protein/PAS domain S-box-containing protein [Solibacillus kalamii]OUZ38499.1 diguanylate cyclase [Solibacillus kalamii]